MDILEFAIQAEKDGEKYYRDVAAKTENKALKQIINMLADDELKHIDYIKEAIKDSAPGIHDTQILDKAKNVFSEMNAGIDTKSIDASYKDLYQKAIDIEKKSEKFYLDKAGELENKAQRDLFLKLAMEEKKHALLLENLLEFVAEPDNWLDNAEFSNLGNFQ